MSNRDLARRAAAEVCFDGVNITKSMYPYLLALTYTDNEEDETDDLQIRLQDREGLWACKWLGEAVEAAASTSLQIDAVIARQNWNGDGKDSILPCGVFELDSIDVSGPPAIVTIKATSLPFSAQIRQTLKSKAWESYTLSGIANEIAASCGMTCMYLAANDPFYQRVEQFKTSDISFLSKLSHDTGISLKVTNKILVLFDQADYEAKPGIFAIKKGSGRYTKYKLNVGTADSQYQSCRVRYVSPTNGKCISGTAYVQDYKSGSKNNQQLEITAKVANAAEAKALAEKHLRLHNKYERTVSFTLPGDPAYVAGITFTVEGWGAWDGKYIIKQAVHTIGSSGYTVQIKGRRVLEGY